MQGDGGSAVCGQDGATGGDKQMCASSKLLSCRRLRWDMPDVALHLWPKWMSDPHSAQE